MTTTATTTIEDREAYRELNARYARHVDLGPADAWAALFTDDGVFDIPGNRATGTEALVGFAAGVLGQGAGMHHVITDHLLEVDPGGETAQGTASVTVLAGGAIRVSGRYEDVLRKVDGGWKLAERRFLPDAAPGS